MIHGQGPYGVTNHTGEEPNCKSIQHGFQLKRRSAVTRTSDSFSTMPFRAIEVTGQMNQRFLSYLVELLSRYALLKQ